MSGAAARRDRRLRPDRPKARRARCAARTSSSAATDVDAASGRALAADIGGRACTDLDELLALAPDVVVVATHPRPARAARRARARGRRARARREAGGLGTGAESSVCAARPSATRRLVKVGFNHRFHPGIARAVAEVHSGAHGELMYLRARYGHGGRARLRPASGAPSPRARAAAS